MRNSVEPTTLGVYLFDEKIAQNSQYNINMFLNGRKGDMGNIPHDISLMVIANTPCTITSKSQRGRVFFTVDNTVLR